MSCVAYAALGMQGCAALASVADIARCAYNSAQGQEITDDAYLDVVADYSELMVLYGRVDKYSGGVGNADGSLTPAEQCFSIVYFTITLITSLEALNGWGPTNTGSEFHASSSRLDDVSYRLKSMERRYGAWSGSAVETYDELRQQLSELVNAVQAADQRTATSVHRQAGQVQRVREEMAATKFSLVGLFLFVAAIVWYYNHFLVDAYVAALENGDRATEGIEMAPLPPEQQMVEVERVNGLHDQAVERTLRGVGLSQGYVAGVMQDMDARGGFFLEQWLPLIVLPPCIGAVTAVGVFLSRLYDDGDSNAQDVKKQTAEYKAVADKAAAILDSPPAYSVRVPAVTALKISDFTLIPVNGPAVGATTAQATHVVRSKPAVASTSPPAALSGAISPRRARRPVGPTIVSTVQKRVDKTAKSCT
ncbi:MAG: hypothetical protein K2Q25_07550 [Mycobacteriaceae bacterium]|nr:hypothetical protein [Mycobacteriaceae bacterium]